MVRRSPRKRVLQGSIPCVNSLSVCAQHHRRDKPDWIANMQTLLWGSGAGIQAMTVNHGRRKPTQVQFLSP